MQNETKDSIKEIWDEFKIDIISKNRYFAGKRILALLDKFQMIKMFPDNSRIDFYRARIGDFTKENISSLLAPPNEKSSGGRCNPEGISYLYLSSCEKTAVSEVRPNPGDQITVAKFSIDVSNIFSFRVYFQGLKLPSNPNSEDSLFLIELIDYDLASKITKQRKLDYIPFQYISEYVKNRGFNGFCYSSTVGPGMNLVIFDWEGKTEIIEKKIVQIRDINYNFD